MDEAFRALTLKELDARERLPYFKVYEMLTQGADAGLHIGGIMIVSSPRSIPQEERCPVPEPLLDQLYRADARGLDDLVSTVPARTRAMLAVYCYQRRHLRSIGLAVAASCEESQLHLVAGHAGTVLFEQARAMPDVKTPTHFEDRQKISLSSGLLREVVRDDDDLT